MLLSPFEHLLVLLVRILSASIFITRCWSLAVSSGQIRLSPDGKTFSQFIKFTLAANVPYSAYIDTSLPRWSWKSLTLASNPWQSALYAILPAKVNLRKLRESLILGAPAPWPPLSWLPPAAFSPFHISLLQNTRPGRRTDVRFSVPGN